MDKAFKFRPYVKISDIFVVAVVILTAVAGFFVLRLKIDNTTPEYACIRVNSQLTDTIDLTKISDSYNITIEGNFPVTLEVSKNGVRFIDSQCKDKLCVHSGLITAGESAACLPGGVSVSVLGSDSRIDGVVG